MKKLVFILAAALVLAGCASGPTISAMTSPDVDWSRFETFGYLPRLGTDRPNGVRSGFSVRLIEAMNHEMSIRGLRLSESPDLVVDFNFVTREGIDVRSSPNMSMHTVHRSHWGAPTSVWAGYTTTVRQYTEGTLLIDLIDLENAVLLGEGSARGRSTNNINSNDFNQTDINRFVTKVMNEMWPLD